MKRPNVPLFCLGVLLACLPLLGQQRREYALILEDPPIAKTVTSRAELRTQAALDADARIETAQQALRRQLAGRHIRVVGSVKTLLNAVFVVVSDEQDLQGLAGVRRVAWLRPIQRHLDRALPLVNVPAGWTSLAAAGFPNAGAGVKIGFLDTGIDQTHPAFQDSSLTAPAGFPKCQPDDCAFTNNKVIVARSYIKMVAAGSGSSPAANSRPDDYTPRDRVGHGTAAATVAAGAQNRGPLATISGVAPKAYVANYKIFGSPGVNDGSTGSALIKALDDAYNDGMEIVSLSLGFPAWFAPLDKGAACGETDPNASCEIEAQAVETAVQRGMMVVVSAGNAGDDGVKSPTMNSVNTPGTAPSAVTVGASRNGHVVYAFVGLTAQDAGSLGSIRASFGDGPKFRVSGPLRDVTAQGDNGLACSALGAGSLSGAIALVQRGTCDFATKATNAQNAGAIGVVIYREDGGEAPFPPAGLAGTGIPAAIIGNTNGRSLKTYLQSHANAPAVMDPSLTAFDDPNVDTVADFSSRGPALGDSTIKPELAAPGTGIYTATQRYDTNGEMYDSSRYTAVDGTSFSAPMVAGAIALVKQKNPGFSTAQLKSAVVNTASAGLQDNGPARVMSVGAGKLDVNAAVRTNVTVEPATLSFGVVTPAVIGTSRSLTIRNGSTSALTLATVGDADTNARLRLSKTTIAASTTDTVAVFLEGNVPLPGAYQGAITITGGAVDLRVPYLYLVSDNVPYNAFPIYNGSFLGGVGQAIPGLAIGLRVVDQYGIPVVGTPVSWQGTAGGASIDPFRFDGQTFLYGEAFAFTFLGSTPGNQEFTATIGTGGSQFALPFQGSARQMPAISAGGVIDAASGRAPQAGQGLAPGSYISIYGTNLSDISLSYDAVLPAGIPPYLPVSLAGVNVSFDVPDQGVSVPGRLTFAGPNQINVSVPWELRGISSALMKVSFSYLKSAVYTVFLSDYAPGIFEAPLGSGLVAASAATGPRAGTVITTASPAQKNQWASIYANGLGPVDNTPPTGELTPISPLARCRATPVVTIGGKTATVDFAGLTPTGFGYYQINVLVPADAPSGNQIVTVSVNGVAAKTVNLPIE